MDLFITDIDALRLTRIARTDAGLILAPCDVHEVTPHAGAGLGPSDLRALEALGLGPFTREAPLNLRVARQEWRSHNPLVRSLVCSSDLPPGSFLQLLPAKPGTLASEALDGRRVYLDSPALILAQLASRTAPLVRSGKLLQQRLLVRLARILMELIGSYSLDASGLPDSVCTFDLDPVCSYEAVQDVLTQAFRLRGLDLACRTSRWANPDSASPMETMLSLASVTPPGMGGFSMEKPLLNHPLELSARQRSLMKHGSMRPDAFWARFHVALEYEGLAYHESAAAMAEDAARMQDYQICGIKVFPVTFADVRTVTALDALMLRVASEMARTGRDGEILRDRVRRLVSDADARTARGILLQELLPPISPRP